MQISTCAESPAENIPLSFKELRETQTPAMWGELDLLCPHRVPPEARGGFGVGGSALAQGQVCM